MNERLGMGLMRREGANLTVPFLTGAGTAGATPTAKVCEGMTAVFFANAAGFEEDMVGVSMTERAEDPASSRASDCMMAKVSTLAWSAI